MAQELEILELRDKHKLVLAAALNGLVLRIQESMSKLAFNPNPDERADLTEHYQAQLNAAQELFNVSEKAEQISFKK